MNERDKERERERERREREREKRERERESNHVSAIYQILVYFNFLKSVIGLL